MSTGAPRHTQPINVGIIGLGVGVNAHIPALTIEGFNVVALAAGHEEKARAAAEKFGVPAAYGDYRSLLEHPGLDAVTVATPTAMHHEVITAALDAGKHVLTEKPVGLTAAEGKDALDRARAAGKTAMIAQAFRFAPARAYVKRLLDQGYVGDVRTVSITFFAGPRGPRPADATPHERRGPGQMHWRMTDATGGGFMDGAGSTFFDSVRDWCGELTGISARIFMFETERLQPDGAIATAADSDQGFFSYFTLATGASGSLSASAAAPYGTGGRIEVFGSTGMLQLNQPGLLPGADATVFGARFEDGPDLRQLAIPADLVLAPDPRDPKPEFYTAYRYIARAFAEGIATGTSPRPSLEDAWREQLITDAIRESSKTGRWIPLAE